MKTTEHGGNLFKLAQEAQCNPQDILDFSVNVRPEGAPSFLKQALLHAMDTSHAYPSPHAEEACIAASRRYFHAPQSFVFGNGSNELIHIIARFFVAHGKTKAYIVEPAFSEYALACKNAGLEIISLWGDVHPQNNDDFSALLRNVDQDSLIFLANPANPSGIFYSRENILNFINSRPDLIWIIDEAFIEYAGHEQDVSLVTLSPESFPQNILVLRSLTKFHAIAGVRLGFLLASEEIAQGILRILPAWTVNCFALQAALAVLQDSSNFSLQTRQDNIKRREHLVAQLKTIDGIELFPSVANYVLFRHKASPPNLASILLQDHRIAIRDCSSYYGLEDKTWYRVAVRIAHEHDRLCTALKAIFSVADKH